MLGHDADAGCAGSFVLSFAIRAGVNLLLTLIRTVRKGYAAVSTMNTVCCLLPSSFCQPFPMGIDQARNLWQRALPIRLHDRHIHIP